MKLPANELLEREMKPIIVTPPSWMNVHKDNKPPIKRFYIIIHPTNELYQVNTTSVNFAEMAVRRFRNPIADERRNLYFYGFNLNYPSFRSVVDNGHRIWNPFLKATS